MGTVGAAVVVDYLEQSVSLARNVYHSELEHSLDADSESDNGHQLMEKQTPTGQKGGIYICMPEALQDRNF